MGVRQVPYSLTESVGSSDRKAAGKLAIQLGLKRVVIGARSLELEGDRSRQREQRTARIPTSSDLRSIQVIYCGNIHAVIAYVGRLEHKLSRQGALHR